VSQNEMKKIKYGCLGLALAVMISGCGGDKNKDTKQDVLYIDHYKSECNSFSLSLCKKSRGSVDDEWSVFYDNIVGFEYEWGYNYTLEITTEEVENPPQDTSSVKYTLDNVLSKVRQSETTLFDVSVSRAPSSDLIKKVSDGLYEIYSDVRFSCSTEQCETIDSLIDQEFSMLFQFRHNADAESPLELVQVKCSDTRELFRESCL
jgi:hypothetical protein